MGEKEMLFSSLPSTRMLRQGLWKNSLAPLRRYSVATRFAKSDAKEKSTENKESHENQENQEKARPISVPPPSNPPKANLFTPAPSSSKIIDSEKPNYIKPLITYKLGVDVLHDPIINKGTAFTASERERLHVRGLVPPVNFDIEKQVARVLRQYNEQVSDIHKHSHLSALHDRNETLFFRTLMENIEEMAPIIYTPTVGEACLQFGTQYRRARGMFLSVQDKNQIHAMVYNWPHDEVDVIVMTDGSRILGLGDLGVYGMAIPIGKLCLYVAAGGIHPQKVLPITIDVGTDNEDIRNDPLYLGSNMPRITGPRYFEFLDEVMQALTSRWPNVLVQFEDFNTSSAEPLLRKYRYNTLCFNDDIQGTGTVTTAGLLCCLKAMRLPYEAICEQKVICLGAGSAGLGVISSIVDAMMEEGLSEEEAKSRFYVLDKDGLLGVERRSLTRLQRSFARADLPDGASLLETIKAVGPTILLGLSGVPGTFTEECIREMAHRCTHQTPIIFPLSNPTSRAECTFEQAVRWTEGRLLFASGSPFSPVEYKGRQFFPTQGNNMYIFPGVGLGVTVCKAKMITNKMLHRAALALASFVKEKDLQKGKVYPSIRQIRRVSEAIALEVCKAAMEEGLAQRPGMSMGNIQTLITEEVYYPDYAPLISRLNH